MAIDNELDDTSLDTEVVSNEPMGIRESLKAAFDAPSEETQTEPTAAERARDEAGKFAKVEKAAEPVVAKPQEKTAQADPAAVASPVAPAVTTPPVSFSAEAKAAFATASPALQAAIAKREEEVNNGFKVLQDYKGLEAFSPMIREAGTTHAAVMKRAIDWEASLQRDPVGTVLHVAKIAGVDLSRLVSGQPQPQQAQQQQPAFDPQMIDRHVQQALSKRETENQVQAFFSDPSRPHVAAVADMMEALIKTGQAKTLQDAYDMAIYANPDIRQTLINEQVAGAAPRTNPQAVAATQARQASRSISGSSAPGPSRQAVGAAPTDLRSTLKAAMAEAGTGA